ncbi:MAG: hypothetical protein ACO4CT_15370, partial [Planctomycetota bacterium]
MNENPVPLPAPDQEPQGLPIGEILAMFWRGRWIIVGAIAIAGALGYSHVESRGTIYEARSELLVQRNGPALVEGPSIFAFEARNFVNTQVARLRSRAVMLAAAERLQSVEMPPDERWPGENILAGAGNLPAWLSRAIKVQVGKSDDVLTVSLESKLGMQACVVVNQVVEAFAATYSSRMQDTAEDAINRLNKSREALETELD